MEVKSSTNRINKGRDKIIDFLDAGVRVGVLIDPDCQTVTVYRGDRDPLELSDGDTLTFPELLPGWEANVTDLWPLVF